MTAQIRVKSKQSLLIANATGQESRVKKPQKKGFTLIELMVSIAIIAVLAAVGAAVYGTAQKTARVSKRVQDLMALQDAIELYKVATGSYPVNTTAVCLNAPTGGIASLSPNYIRAIPQDPLPPNCYWYISDAAGTEYKVRTGGSTSAGANSDIPANDSAYKTQYQMIDPHRDGTAATSATNCAIEATNSANFSPTAWSLHTNNACNF